MSDHEGIDGTSDFDGIDGIVTESLRRRGATARIGRGAIVDVQRRIVARRRRLVGGVCAAVALPSLAGIAILATMDKRDSPATVAEAGDESDSAGPAAAFGGAAGGWRCNGEPTDTGDGWTVFPYCEPLCAALPDVGPSTTVVLAPTSTEAPPSLAPTSTVAPPAVETSTTIETAGATSTSTTVEDLASTTVVQSGATSTTGAGSIVATNPCGPSVDDAG